MPVSDLLLDALDEKYLETFSNAVELVKKHDKVRVIAHYDGDGVSGASIVIPLLKKHNKKFHLSFIKGITEDLANMLPNDGTPILMIDIGSSALDVLSKYENVVLLDHHPLVGKEEGIINLDPLKYGYDGTREACGTTISFLFSIFYDNTHFKYIPYFFAGTIADRQHVGGYSGINSTIVTEALDKKYVEKVISLPYLEKGLGEELTNQLDPYLVGITGRKDKVLALLKNLNIDPNKKLLELDEEETKRLNSYIMYHLLKQGTIPDIASDSIAPRYISTDKDFQIKNTALLSSFMNACGREGKESLGVQYSLGKIEVLNEIVEMQKRYNAKVLEGLIALEKKEYTELSSIIYFKSHYPSIAGAQAGIAVSYFTPPKKPVFGYAIDDQGKAKISSRGTWYMVSHNLNLTEVCSVAAKSVNGHGGGHTIASGANIDGSSIEEFMSKANEIVGKQLKF